VTSKLYYPPADLVSQWFHRDYPGAEITPTRTVWHTTESLGWPGYSGGATAPGWTYHPGLRRWRQHFWANESSRALRNLEGGVETNTRGAHQVEIVAYSDEALAALHGGLPVSRLSPTNLADLAAFAAWQHAEWGVPLAIDPGWVRSDYRNPTRMRAAQWLPFEGHTGHNRVPENIHWDPARLNIDTVIQLAKDTDMPTAQEIAKAILDAKIPNLFSDDPDDEITVRGALAYDYARIARIDQRVRDLAAVGGVDAGLVTAILERTRLTVEPALAPPEG